MLAVSLHDHELRDIEHDARAGMPLTPRQIAAIDRELRREPLTTPRYKRLLAVWIVASAADERSQGAPSSPERETGRG